MKKYIEAYNLDKLVKVKAVNFTPSVWYETKTEKKWLGRVTRNAGIYKFPFDDYIGTTPPKNHTIIDGEIYLNPYVKLHYQGGHEKTYYFEKFEEAEFFAKSLTNDRKWLKDEEKFAQ